jgi:hypothetical protein
MSLFDGYPIVDHGSVRCRLDSGLKGLLIRSKELDKCLSC